MNQVSLKLYNIRNTGTCFQGSSQTITEDIVSTMTEKKQKQKPAAKISTSDLWLWHKETGKTSSVRA